MIKRLLFISIFMFFTSQALAATEIKLALIAPEGSTWINVMNEWNAELVKKTAGRVKLKLYPGGVLGDERDVIRKMQYGQVHAAGFTGYGLGVLNPQVRLLELPMLTQSYAEMDKIAAKFQPKLEKGFEKKGFVLLAWNETGFVHIFSNKAITKVKDLKGVRMWAWEGDPLIEKTCRVFGIVPIPLALPEVYTSLQTSLVDAVYAPPLGAIALQWFTQTKYLSDLKLANSTGGIVITKKALQGLSAADQSILKTTARKYSRMLVQRVRADNDKSFKTLQAAGLKVVSFLPAEVELISRQSKKVWNGLAGKLYSKALLNELKSYLAELRK